MRHGDIASVLTDLTTRASGQQRHKKKTFWTCPAYRRLSRFVAFVLKNILTLRMDCDGQRLKEKENEYRNLK